MKKMILTLAAVLAGGSTMAELVQFGGAASSRNMSEWQAQINADQIVQWNGVSSWGGGFGSPAASTGFGAPAAPAPGGFGAPAASTGFGAPAAPAVGGFGAPAVTAGFGAPAAPAAQSSPFGAKPALGGFGAPAAGGFGALSLPVLLLRGLRLLLLFLLLCPPFFTSCIRQLCRLGTPVIVLSLRDERCHSITADPLL